MTDKDAWPKKDLLEKASASKRFEFSPLDKELKKQIILLKTSTKILTRFLIMAKKRTIKNWEEEPLTTEESSPFYNNKYTFNEFKNAGKYEDESLESRYNNYLTPFIQRSKELEKFTYQTVKTKKNKTIRLCIKMLENYIVN